MRISLSVWDYTAPAMIDLARAAERCGFHAIWVGEHVLAPLDYQSPHPGNDRLSHRHRDDTPIIAPDTELVDPLIALAGVATATERIGLATGVLVLPLRHPLHVARSAMTLQDLAQGRFRLGVGAGWLEEEFAALDQPFLGRGARLEEELHILAAAFAGGEFQHHGGAYDIARVQLSPRPIPVPVVFGGNSPRALRRAARLGSGWFASGTPNVDEVTILRDSLLRQREALGNDRPIRTVVRSPTADLELLNAYEGAGFDEVVVWADQLWIGDALPDRDAALAEAAERLGL